MKSVSVLIPCYNAENWLNETLESVFSQSWPKIEVILVDDGSTDGSLAVAERYISRGLKIKSQNRRGACAARNRALRESTGEFIQYLDADDVLSPTKIENQMRRLAESPSGTIALGRYGKFSSTADSAEFEALPIFRDMPVVDWIVTSWQGGGATHPACWLTPRKVAEEAGGWNEDLSSNPNDDGEYFTRVILKSRRVAYCQDAVSYYRVGSNGSLSSYRSELSLQSLYRSLELSAEHLLNIQDTAQTREAAACNFRRVAELAFRSGNEKLLAACEQSIRGLGCTTPARWGPLPIHVIYSLFGWQWGRVICRWLRSVKQCVPQARKSQAAVRG